MTVSVSSALLNHCLNNCKMKRSKHRTLFVFDFLRKRRNRKARIPSLFDCALTVAHVLLECNHYNVVRQRYFNVSSLYELFDTVNAQNILGFIRDIGLHRLL